MQRKRKDPRREITRSALIEAAEELIADRGIENVTLRQIGEAIGSDNNAVVTYYFGNKAGLLRAIYEHRIPGLEARRSELLHAADETGRGADVFTLLHALWAPIFEQRNKKGKASYAGFLSSTANSPLISTRVLSRAYSSTKEIADRLLQYTGLSEDHFWQRQRFVSMMMIAAIQETVKLKAKQARQAEIQAIYTDALRMAAAAFSTPYDTGDPIAELGSK